MVRELPEQLDEKVRFASRRGPLRKFRRFHPGMIEEMLIHPQFDGIEDGAAVSWMIFISMLREDLPWLYEPGMELYRAMRSGNELAVQRAHRELVTIARMTSRGPLFHDILGPDDKESFFFMRHFDEFVGRIVVRYESTRAKT